PGYASAINPMWRMAISCTAGSLLVTSKTIFLVVCAHTEVATTTLKMSVEIRFFIRADICGGYSIYEISYAFVFVSRLINTPTALIRGCVQIKISAWPRGSPLSKGLPERSEGLCPLFSEGSLPLSYYHHTICPTSAWLRLRSATGLSCV